MGPGGHGPPTNGLCPHEPEAPVPHKKSLEALAVLWAAGGSGLYIISCLDSVLYAERLYD